MPNFTITNHTLPPYSSPHRHSPRDVEFAGDKVREMLDAGIIRHSHSTSYAAEYTCTAKKDENGDWTDMRFCKDYRLLNDCTELEKYPLPVAEEVFNDLGQAKFFTKIDLRSGFNQIPIAPEDMEKTTF